MRNTTSLSRRASLLAAGGLMVTGLAKAASAAAPTPGTAAGVPAQNATEQANAKAIHEFFRLWGEQDTTADKVGAFIAENGAVKLSPTGAATVGKAQVTEFFAKILKSGQRFHMEILETFSRGDIVTTLRREVISAPGKPNQAPFLVTSVFYMQGGKIQEWNDYPLPKT